MFSGADPAPAPAPAPASEAATKKPDLINSKIVGGVDVSIVQFPFQVMIWTQKNYFANTGQGQK